MIMNSEYTLEDMHRFLFELLAVNDGEIKAGKAIRNMQRMVYIELESVRRARECLVVKPI